MAAFLRSLFNKKMTITQLQKIAAGILQAPVCVQLISGQRARIVAQSSSTSFLLVKQLTRAAGSKRDATILTEDGHIVIELRFAQIGHITATPEEKVAASLPVSRPPLTEIVEVPTEEILQKWSKELEEFTLEAFQ